MIHADRIAIAKRLTRIASTAALLLLAAHTQITAQVTAPAIDVLHYEGDVRITPASKELSGKAGVTLRNPGTSPLTAIPLDLVSMTVTSVEVDGQTAAYSYDGSVLTTELGTPLQPGDSTDIEVTFSGSPGNEGGSSPWGGCHWGSVSYFMGVGFRAPSVSLMRLWLPSNDIPNDKATFDITFTVPEGLVVAGTGLLRSQSSADGWSRFRWVETHPTATYLFTYAISEYAVVRDQWNGIPMEYYVNRADSARGVQYFTTVPGMMEAFTARFGPYPFDKVGYCITPIGSMEHQTMISYAEQLFRYETRAGTTAAHELAHMWWGDWVTCEDFGDAWLNEGFAVFSEMVYAEYLGGESRYLESVRSASQSYRTSIVPAEGMLPLHDFPRAAPSSNYPSTIYQKGGAVLAMLRDVMGDDAFFEGLRDYGNRHAYGNATTEGFQSVMEEHHGSSLHWFFDQWVFKPGYPIFTLQRVVDNSGAPLRLRIMQTHDTLLYPLYAMPMDVAVILTSGDTLRKRIDCQALGYQEFTFSDIPANTVQNALLDPRGVVLKRVNYRTVSSANDVPARPSGVTIEALYPNPADGGVTVTLKADAYTPLRLVLYDSSGRAVLREEVAAALGTQSIRLNTTALASGSYTLALISASATTIASVLISHR